MAVDLAITALLVLLYTRVISYAERYLREEAKTGFQKGCARFAITLLGVACIVHVLNAMISVYKEWPL